MSREACNQTIRRVAEPSGRSGDLPSLGSTLIVGYGNDLRSDDGAGVIVARKVAVLWPQARVIVVHQLTPELAEDIAMAGKVIFVDAFVAHAREEALRIEKMVEHADVESSVVEHRVLPWTLVNLARRLYGSPTEAWVLGVPAYCLDAGEFLSPETLCRIDEAVALIGGQACPEK